MRHLMPAAVLLLCAARAGAQEPHGHAADRGETCRHTFATEQGLVTHGFFFIENPVTVSRLTGKLAAHLVCSAKDKRAKDPCAALDRMQPAYKYVKEVGTLKARCAFLNGYADFWWEVMTADKKQRSFPACEAHLASLTHPVQFFDLKAKAPRGADPDPTNDGGFWNMCKVIGERMRQGSSDICDKRAEHYLSPQVPRELWKDYCDGIARLWVHGDDAFCERQKPSDDYCRAAAQLTRAFRKADMAACPPGGLERGLCLQKLSTKAASGCALAWTELQGDFCAERALVPDEKMPKRREGTAGAELGILKKKGTGGTKD